jgi:hypothetical protein
MLTITKRGAYMGRINNRLQRHGEESVTAFDVPLSSMHLEPEELNALLGVPRAHDALFTRGLDGKSPQPTFEDFAPLALAFKLDEVRAELFVGMKHEPLVFTNAKLARIRLEPQPGGMTLLSATLQIVPDMAKQAAKLLAWQDHDISVDLGEGKRVTDSREQGELDVGAAPAEAA